MLEDYIFFAKLSYFMTFGEIELWKSVIHIWPPQWGLGLSVYVRTVCLYQLEHWSWAVVSPEIFFKIGNRARHYFWNCYHTKVLRGPVMNFRLFLNKEEALEGGGGTCRFSLFPELLGASCVHIIHFSFLAGIYCRDSLMRLSSAKK